MATKDWKKVKPSNPDLGDLYQWEKGENKRIWIQKTSDDSYWVNALNGYYMEKNKRFNTKSQALSFAKSYMRTH